MNGILDRTLPYKANTVNYFFRFWAMEFQEKIVLRYTYLRQSLNLYYQQGTCLLAWITDKY